MCFEKEMVGKFEKSSSRKPSSINRQTGYNIRLEKGYKETKFEGKNQNCKKIRWGDEVFLNLSKKEIERIGGSGIESK